MTITIALFDADDGTEVIAVHEGLPSGVRSGQRYRVALLFGKACCAVEKG